MFFGRFLAGTDPSHCPVKDVDQNSTRTFVSAHVPRAPDQGPALAGDGGSTFADHQKRPAGHPVWPARGPGCNGTPCEGDRLQNSVPQLGTRPSILAQIEGRFRRAARGRPGLPDGPDLTGHSWPDLFDDTRPSVARAPPRSSSSRLAKWLSHSVQHRVEVPAAPVPSALAARLPDRLR